MFGLILPSRPVLGPPALQTISPTQFAYTFPAWPAFSHLVVFLLPDNTIPADMLAGIYIQFPAKDRGTVPDFKLLGALSADKQSAIFRVSSPPQTAGEASGVLGEIGGVAEVDMDADEPEGVAEGMAGAALGGMSGGDAAGPAQGGNVTVGISVEPAATLQPQLAALAQSGSAAGTRGLKGAGGALALQRPQGSGGAPDTKVLAQRIIENAFNFLASFAGGDGKVPLKSFEEWWRKFERRVQADPGFLEREQ